MNVEYPAAQVAVVHSLVSAPLHSEQVSTEATVAKSLQQNPDGMNAEYPDAHVAAVQSLICVPLHDVHALTDGSDALQHPVNGEKAPPSQDTTG